MSDLARLTEALAVLDDPPNGDGRWQSDLAVGAAIHIAIDAARLVATGKSGWYCETHEQWGWNDARCWAADMGPDLCRMVDAVLVIPLPDKETTDEPAPCARFPG